MPIEIHTPNSSDPILNSKSNQFPYWSANTTQDFVTLDSLNNYVKTSKSFKFKIRAERNAFIIFVLHHRKRPKPYYHICFGNDLNNNTSSTYNPTTGIQNIIKTPNILSSNEFNGFWMKWTTNCIQVGREMDEIPFIEWNDPSVDLNLNNLKIAFCTIGVNGTWIIDDSDFRLNLSSEPSEEGHSGFWVPACGGNIPPGAVPDGHDSGEQQYIARGYFDNQLIPGKLHPSHGCCYVTFEGHEYVCRDYEVLCTITGIWSWMGHNDDLPPDALKSICKRTGQVFHIGRGYRNGALVIGKIYPSSKLCYIGYDGIEELAVDYEIFRPIANNI